MLSTFLSPVRTLRLLTLAGLALVLLSFSIACSAQALAQPTPTPTNTPLPTPTSTPLPTNTPVPTATATDTPVPTLAPIATPVPPTDTSVPMVFAITGTGFESDGPSTCETDITITEVNGEELAFNARVLSITQNGISIWCYGATHVWTGTWTWHGYTFASDADDPLVFRLLESSGYTYISGSGTVTQPGGEVVALGSGVATTPPGAAQTLFEDDFSSDKHNWKTGLESDSDGTIERAIVNGKYQISMTAADEYFWTFTYLPDVSAKDLSLSVDMTVIETSAQAGDLTVTFSLRNTDGDYYNFYFDSDGGYEVLAWKGGDYTSLINVSDSTAFSLQPGIQNTVTILASGSTFTVSMNGAELYTITDETITEAGDITIGLCLDDTGDTLVIEFDNIVIQTAP